jgi:hypothetical protein
MSQCQVFAVEWQYFAPKSNGVHAQQNRSARSCNRARYHHASERGWVLLSCCQMEDAGRAREQRAKAQEETGPDLTVFSAREVARLLAHRILFRLGHYADDVPSAAGQATRKES